MWITEERTLNKKAENRILIRYWLGQGLKGKKDKIPKKSIIKPNVLYSIIKNDDATIMNE